MNAVREEEKIGMGREWRLPDTLYEDDLDLCGKSEEDLKNKLIYIQLQKI